jgi:hypothetical protein
MSIGHSHFSARYAGSVTAMVYGECTKFEAAIATITAAAQRWTGMNRAAARSRGGAWFAEAIAETFQANAPYADSSADAPICRVGDILRRFLFL